MITKAELHRWWQLLKKTRNPTVKTEALDRQRGSNSNTHADSYDLPLHGALDDEHVVGPEKNVLSSEEKLAMRTLSTIGTSFCAITFVCSKCSYCLTVRNKYYKLKKVFEPICSIKELY